MYTAIVVFLNISFLIVCTNFRTFRPYLFGSALGNYLNSLKVESTWSLLGCDMSVWA